MSNPFRWLARLLKRDELTDAERRALDTVAIYSAGGMSYERPTEKRERENAEGLEESTEEGLSDPDRFPRA
ncbi:MAG TPA: hypothetical protein VJ898_08405 [Natrialbaceae archaeon]|nr:hypothetical protein [Natrialbaceae archaeon]